MSEKQSIDAETLHGKAVALTAMSLERRGCEIVGSGLRRNGFPFDIVARVGKETAFVEVSVDRDWDSFLERDGDAVREMREAAAAYVEGHGDTRIDVAHVKFAGNGNALLRYRKGAYGDVLEERG